MCETYSQPKSAKALRKERAERLKDSRQKLGLSLEQLRSKIERSTPGLKVPKVPQFSKMEKGIAPISSDLLASWVKVVDIGFDELFGISSPANLPLLIEHSEMLKDLPPDMQRMVGRTIADLNAIHRRQRDDHK